MFPPAMRQRQPHPVPQIIPQPQQYSQPPPQFIEQGYPEINQIRQVNRSALQPLYVIPITTAQQFPPNITLPPAIMDLPCPRLEPQCSSWNIIPNQKRGRKSDLLPEERDLNRRVKKQNMERRRRACISDKLSALHTLAVSLVGETPQQQTQQRTEITDILNQCVSVLEGLSEFVKGEPELQAKMRHLGVPIRDTPSEQRKLRLNSGEPQLASTPLIPPTLEKNNENRPPLNLPSCLSRQCSAFTPVLSTPTTPMMSVLQQQSSPEWNSCLPSVATCLKRSSIDSCFSTPSSTSSSAFSNSASSSSSAERSHKRTRTYSPCPPVWRPYLD